MLDVNRPNFELSAQNSKDLSFHDFWCYYNYKLIWGSVTEKEGIDRTSVVSFLKPRNLGETTLP